MCRLHSVPCCRQRIELVTGRLPCDPERKLKYMHLHEVCTACSVRVWDEMLALMSIFDAHAHCRVCGARSARGRTAHACNGCMEHGLHAVCLHHRPSANAKPRSRGRDLRSLRSCAVPANAGALSLRSARGFLRCCAGRTLALSASADHSACTQLSAGRVMVAWSTVASTHNTQSTSAHTGRSELDGRT